MDKSSLESSIRDESRLAIQAIKDKEASEVMRLDDLYADEIEAYRTKTSAETDARIEQELSKITNRSMLERKKRNLKLIEDFISRSVEEAVKGLRDDPRYRLFIVETLVKAAGQVHGRAEVHLKEQDRALGEEIMEKFTSSAGKHKLVIHEDNTIKWGGCTIKDEQGGRIFNATIKRICFRNYQIIRRELMKIMREKGLID